MSEVSRSVQEYIESVVKSTMSLLDQTSLMPLIDALKHNYIDMAKNLDDVVEQVAGYLEIIDNQNLRISAQQSQIDALITSITADHLTLVSLASRLEDSITLNGELTVRVESLETAVSDLTARVEALTP